MMVSRGTKRSLYNSCLFHYDDKKREKTWKSSRKRFMCLYLHACRQLYLKLSQSENIKKKVPSCSFHPCYNKLLKAKMHNNLNNLFSIFLSLTHSFFSLQLGRRCMYIYVRMIFIIMNYMYNVCTYIRTY